MTHAVSFASCGENFCSNSQVAAFWGQRELLNELLGRNCYVRYRD
jgi:hypothetical protein